ncbi:MAG: tRNA guanosine(34) transglycosylase Tgt [Treponema sp.]|nr:tRNA guanosine(34) transglycosylase Tgt [Treponema sp.]
MSIFIPGSSDPSSSARTGTLVLPHGRVETPVFMPVGTNGTVKALTREDLYEIGFDLILANTYHLYLRPGMEVIEGAGDLHRFMGWDRNLLTDSGGFQVFSLSPLRNISSEGVSFKSHIDGSSHVLSPEKAVDLQVSLGSDIQMQLDVCTGYGVSYREAREALDTTSHWMDRARARWEERREGGYGGFFFPIVQGNFFKDLRAESARRTIETDPPGIAIGGLSVGEPREVYQEFLSYTASLLPPDKPRYAMGIGTPEYILEAIQEGIDMFDCVFPTRNARNGTVFTRRGSIALKKAEHRLDFMPIDETCACKVCRSYSRAYLRHLFKTKEILCSILASYHNLYFLHRLVKDAAAAIREQRFRAFKEDFLREMRDEEA